MAEEQKQVEGSTRVCPFFQKPCSVVCKNCELYTPILQHKIVLGIGQSVQTFVCAFTALVHMESSLVSQGMVARNQPPQKIVLNTGRR